MCLRRNISRLQWVTLAIWSLLLWAGIVVSIAHAEASSKLNLESQNLRAMTSMTPMTPNISCPIVMSLIPSPNAIPGFTGLHGVDALGPNDVWAAGSDLNGTLIEHWNGTSWRVLPDPGPGTLLDIEALSPTDVWVVGVRDGLVLTAHWDGVAWTIVPNQISGTLDRVSAVSSSDIWAVGNASDGTLIMHWNGSQWSRTISPNVGELFHVDAISANDVWAVGAFQSNTTTVSLHWDGSVWSRIPSPNPSNGYGGAERNVLHSIEAISANDVWAVGYTGYDDGTGGQYTTLAMHWNGVEWRVVPTPPNLGTGPNFLLALSAASTNDVWAVGNYYTIYNQVSYTLILHWNGTNWSITPSPSTTETHRYLYGVKAIPGGDVWSVGEHGPSPGGYGYNKQALVQRWNGAQWTLVSTPVEEYSSTLRGAAALSPNRAWAVGNYTSPDGSTRALFEVWQGFVWQSHRVTVDAPGSLSAVAAVSQVDAWAVGYYTDQGVDKTLAVRYNGDVADQRNTPNVGVYSNYLTSVEVVSATDVWAVSYYQLTSDPSQTRSLVAHWNGGEWSLFPTPDISSASRLDGIAAVSANDIWAVGRDNDRALTMHWDGSQWRIIPTPNVAAMPNVLMGVATTASDDVWAVGHSGLPNARQSLTLHWDGTTWNIAPNPNVGTSNFLLSVASLSENNVVAVGAYVQEGITHTLVEHWDGVNWSVLPSPNANSEGNYFSGVVAASPTEAWAVGGYQAGAMQRPLTTFYKPLIFSDVPAGSAFYAPVNCLLCRGLISGYADGTFRPNNQVTRGQLAKIVSNAAGFTEDPGAQIYEDVAPGYTFYEWINRLSRRGYMGGYACGGVGEPCNTGMPYFRPVANATRGQTSKIVANAAGYSEVPTEQTFEDVPPTHTFYREIQRLASRNIMGGYSCGGVGEPCTTGRPYFRSSNNVTRGQSAKIVANTFFPACATP